MILVNKATEPNPAYAMSNRQVVNNWFDGELDDTCWSVKDNMAAAMAAAKVGPVLKAITDKAAAARGDVCLLYTSLCRLFRLYSFALPFVKLQNGADILLSFPAGRFICLIAAHPANTFSE